jgi:uncharacterized protein YkwD
MDAFVLATLIAAIIGGVNQYRVQHGALPVYENAKLMRAAQAHAEYMAKTYDLRHNDVQKRVRDYGYNGGVYENIAMGGNPLKIWAASDAHASNMRATGVHIGIGCHYANGNYFYCLLIGVGDNE